MFFVGFCHLSCYNQYGYCHNGRRLVLLLCGGLQSVFTLSFRKNQCKIRTVILRIHRHPSGKLMERRTEPMSILDFIAIVSFGLTCFSIGYTFGKDSHKTQKQPPQSDMYPFYWTSSERGIFMRYSYEFKRKAVEL